MLAVVIGRAAPLRIGNNAIIILLLKDLCCIRSLASQAALSDRLTGTGAGKHGAANYRENMHSGSIVPSHVILLRSGGAASASCAHSRILVSDPHKQA